MTDTAVRRRRDSELTDLQQRIFQVAYVILGDRTASEDVSQETIARVVEHRDSWRGEGDFFAWACAIAVNLCRGKRKQEKRAPRLLEQRTLERTELRDPAHGPATSVVLHYIEGLPYADIARILDITSGAARLRARRAKEALRENLASMLSPEVHRRLQADGLKE